MKLIEFLGVCASLYDVKIIVIENNKEIEKKTIYEFDNLKPYENYEILFLNTDIVQDSSGIYKDVANNFIIKFNSIINVYISKERKEK